MILNPFFRCKVSSVSLPFFTNQEISVVEKSPVLGVLIDKDLNNVAQCNAVKAKLCYKWWQVKKYCNPNWGLKLKTVMIIVNATILPTLFYAAPSWLHTRKSLEVFNPLLYQMLTIACGSYYKPDRKTLECITGFVPLETQLNVISSKFLLKNFIQHVPDSLTCTITSCSQLQKHFVSEHINNLKRYLASRSLIFPVQESLNRSSSHSFMVTTSLISLDSTDH